MLPSSQGGSPFPIAHRAGNDLAVLSRAESMGLPLVEADVRLFRGRLEIRHLKTVGPLPVLWDRWELASPFAPRLLLDELLDAAAPGTELLLDLKGRDMRLGLAVRDALAAAARPATSVTARSWRLLDAFSGLTGIRTFHSVGTARQLGTLERGTAGGPLEGVSVHARLLDAAAAERLHRLASTVITWPVATLEHARLLGSWGVDGVITQDLALAETLMRDRLATERVMTDRTVR